MERQILAVMQITQQAKNFEITVFTSRKTVLPTRDPRMFLSDWPASAYPSHFVRPLNPCIPFLEIAAYHGDRMDCLQPLPLFKENNL